MDLPKQILPPQERRSGSNEKSKHKDARETWRTASRLSTSNDNYERRACFETPPRPWRANALLVAKGGDREKHGIFQKQLSAIFLLLVAVTSDTHETIDYPSIITLPAAFITLFFPLLPLTFAAFAAKKRHYSKLIFLSTFLYSVAQRVYATRKV